MDHQKSILITWEKLFWNLRGKHKLLDNTNNSTSQSNSCPKLGLNFGAVPQNLIYEKLQILCFKKDNPLLTKFVLSHDHSGGRLNIEKDSLKKNVFHAQRGDWSRSIKSIPKLWNRWGAKIDNTEKCHGQFVTRETFWQRVRAPCIQHIKRKRQIITFHHEIKNLPSKGESTRYLARSVKLPGKARKNSIL